MAVAKAATLFVLILNIVAIGNDPAIARAVGPVHGTFYLLGVLLTWSAGYTRATKLIAIIPVIGAYACEALLIDDDRIPALHEDLDDLRAAPLLWLAARVGERLVGAVAWSEDGKGLDIDRLVVAPDMRRRVGSSLVGAVLARAGTCAVVVSTGRHNSPARSLYEQLGFGHIGDREVVPGLWVSRYSRRPVSEDDR